MTEYQSVYQATPKMISNMSEKDLENHQNLYVKYLSKYQELFQACEGITRESERKTLKQICDCYIKLGKNKVSPITDHRQEKAFMVKCNPVVGIEDKYDKVNLCLPYKLERARKEIDVWSFGALLYCHCRKATFPVHCDDDIDTFDAMNELYFWDQIKREEKLNNIDDEDAKICWTKFCARNLGNDQPWRRFCRMNFSFQSLMG